ncbi:MAG: hypothetical protein JWP97_694 [Labilithrix sp.]|nr:hypothetical protein [Labilithrix sp.]
MAPSVETVVARSAGSAVSLRYVRSTLLVSSIEELRCQGLLERYRRALDPAAVEVLMRPLSAPWMPVSIAEAHYAACEAIASPELAFELGKSSGVKVQESGIASLARLATNAGVTPWTVLAHYPRLWARVFDGGSAKVVKVGPKDARICLDGFPLARFAYVREALRGGHDAMLRFFANQVFVRTAPSSLTATSYVYEIAWA